MARTRRVGLTAKEQRFCEEYLIDGNGAKSAIRAGYSAKTAREIACQNLIKLHIKSYLNELQQVQRDKAEGGAQWVRQMLIDNAKRAIQVEPVLDAKGSPTGEYRYEGQVLNRAVELIGKLNGQFTERIEHTGQITQKIYRGLDPDKM